MSENPQHHTAEVPLSTCPRVWRLRILFGSKERIRVIRRGEKLILGSGDSSDVCLDDPTISGRHCEILATDEGLRVLDLGSKNGLFVGSGKVTSVILGGTSASFSLGRTTVVAEERTSRTSHDDQGFIGRSDAMDRVREKIERFARLRGPVLISGESGTGKDLVARAIHAASLREGSYCPLNVAALPDSLLDAELFGHSRGAFTGAVAVRQGLFEAAEGGTLFLDEIAELSPGGQAKLLRVVEDGSVRAIGADRARQLDVRIVSATCAPLRERISDGTFRGDLYHRLAALVIELPPLRQRTEDIPLLAEAYLQRIADEVGPKYLLPATVDVLRNAPWPGNVRELHGVLYRAAALTTDEALSPGHLAIEVSVGQHRPRLVAERAQEFLDCHGSISAAARAAGVPRTTFRSVLERDKARRAD